jgi:fructokinase
MENPNTSAKVVAAGEALMDMILQPDGSLMPHDGGAVYNLARALGLGGVATQYLNPLSSDTFGQGLRRSLEKAGVHMPAHNTVAQPTSLAVVGVDAQGKASYGFYREGVADRQTSAAQLTGLCNALPDLQVVCTGCLALLPDDQGIYQPWLQAMRAAGKTVVVDANLRPAVVPDTERYTASVMGALRQAHLVKASDDDLICMGFTHADPVVAARELMQQTGAALMALTLGAKGAVLLTADGRAWHATETAPVQVKDTVGAGDCFLAGLVNAWVAQAATAGVPPHQLVLTDAHLQELLRWGVASATLNCQQAGCQPPSRADITARLAVAAPACQLL